MQPHTQKQNLYRFDEGNFSQLSPQKHGMELKKKQTRTRCGEINLYGNHMVCSE